MLAQRQGLSRQTRSTSWFIRQSIATGQQSALQKYRLTKGFVSLSFKLLIFIVLVTFDKAHLKVWMNRCTHVQGFRCRDFQIPVQSGQIGRQDCYVETAVAWSPTKKRSKLKPDGIVAHSTGTLLKRIRYNNSWLRGSIETQRYYFFEKNFKYSRYTDNVVAGECETKETIRSRETRQLVHLPPLQAHSSKMITSLRPTYPPREAQASAMANVCI